MRKYHKTLPIKTTKNHNPTQMRNNKTQDITRNHKMPPVRNIKPS